MINLTNKEIEDKIENFEYGNNAMKFNGGSVIINSIDIDEDEEIVRADITLAFDMDNRSERYGDFELLGVVVE